MKLSVTVFLGLMLAMLAVTVSGKPETYLVETVDNAYDAEKIYDASVKNFGFFNSIKYNIF